MNLYTYLRIKQAASADDLWRANKRALENAGEAASYRNQVSDLQSQLNKLNPEIDRLQNLVDNGDAERLRMIQEINGYNQQLSDANAQLKAQREKYDANESNWKSYMASANEERDKAVADAIRQQQEKYDANESNWQNYMTDVNKQIDDLNEELKYQKGNSAWKTEMYKALKDRNNATNKQLNRAAAKNNGRANTIRRQAEQIVNQRNMLADEANTIDRMRRNASIGGAVGGAALGGAGGYAGSKWLANKLKLTGRKALAAKLLGTAAGSALGGAGGYYLGRNI